MIISRVHQPLLVMLGVLHIILDSSDWASCFADFPSLPLSDTAFMEHIHNFLCGDGGVYVTNFIFERPLALENLLEHCASENWDLENKITVFCSCC